MLLKIGSFKKVAALKRALQKKVDNTEYCFSKILAFSKV